MKYYIFPSYLWDFDVEEINNGDYTSLVNLKRRVDKCIISISESTNIPVKEVLKVLDKNTDVVYTTTQMIGKIVSSNKPVPKEDGNALERLMHKSMLYDSDVLQFYSGSKDDKPGRGAGDKVNCVGDYELLAGYYKNFRKMLSNFYYSPFTLDGKKWATVEHYYQASKFKKSNPEFYEAFSMDTLDLTYIIDTKDPFEAKVAGGKTGVGTKGRIRPTGVNADSDFFNGRAQVEMKRAQFAKFTQNEDLMKMLLLTRNAKLFHVTRGTKIVFNELMEIRSWLRNIKGVNFTHHTECEVEWSKPTFAGENSWFDFNKQPLQWTITITFGEVAENHVRMQKIGEMRERGFLSTDLYKGYCEFTKRGYKCELIDLREALPKEQRPFADFATVLVVRGGVQALLGDKYTIFDLLKEQRAFQEEGNEVKVDTQAIMYNQVCNKRARHNLCFAEESQAPDLKQGKGTVVSFKDIPVTSTIRDNLPMFVGDIAQGLMAEGNYYYNIKDCGIGFHGDGERFIVSGVRIGASMPLHYRWYIQSKPIGKPVEIIFNNGDIYFMSEKATGHDWKSRNIMTLRHAAGAPKYTNPPKPKKSAKK